MLDLFDWFRYVAPAIVVDYSPRLRSYLFNVLDHTDGGFRDPFGSIDGSLNASYNQGVQDTLTRIQRNINGV